MTHCIFCDIVKDKSKAKIIFEDDEFLAFEDTHPQAPVHFLVIPKKHIETILNADEPTLGRLLAVAAQEAKRKGIDKDGFRTIINCNRHAGQSIYHLHAHVMGGRWFSWPPG
jgi:histidine triad (HIT) family protein